MDCVSRAFEESFVNVVAALTIWHWITGSMVRVVAIYEIQESGPIRQISRTVAPRQIRVGLKGVDKRGADY